MGIKKGSVLCVDDEPNILRSLRWLLQREFEVMTAPSGQDALALVRQNNFDVIISDQRMPGMSGVELLREVRKIAPRAMRILLTGYSDVAAVMRSVNESEVFRFINKPWHINDLPRVVEEAATIAQAHPAPAPTPEAAEDTPIDNQIETLLLVDDDEMAAMMLQQLVGSTIKVAHARSLAEAIDALAAQNVGVIVSDTRVAGMDATRLLKMLKQQYPEIVAVVLTEAVDAGDIIALINQGQIYRFVPKPIKAGFLKLVVTSAILKHHQLKESPDFVKRHMVERVAADTKDDLMKDVQQVAALGAVASSAAAPAGPAGAESLLQRVSSGFRHLFGGK